MGEMSCAPQPLRLTNTLHEPLRLSWISVAEEGPATAHALPAWSRQLHAHERREIEVPGSGGWLLAEQLVWRGVVAEAALTHVVRKASNISTGTVALPPPHAAASDAGVAPFNLLLSAERQPLQLCSAAPSGEERCHGMLDELGSRYLEGLTLRSSLLAYQPVWGVKLAPLAASPPPMLSLRVERALALRNAPYAAAYRAHVAAVARPSPPPMAGGEVRFFNHLPQPALLCVSSDAALECSLHVRARTATPPRPAPPRPAHAASAAWEVYELVQRLPLPAAPRLLHFGAAPPHATPPPSAAAAASRGAWALRNPFPFALLACEAPSPADAADLELEAARAVEARRLECLPPLAPNSSTEAEALPDRRALPRDRVLLGFRLAHHVSLGGAPREVGLGSGAAGGFAVWATAAEGRRHSDMSLGSGVADVWRRGVADVWRGGGASAEHPEPKEPPPTLAAEEACAREYAHEGVAAALHGIRLHWSNISVALFTGDVPIELPGDAIEMGTDADPTRKLLLTKAMLELPHTHPLAIAAPKCSSDGCAARLAAQMNFSLFHADVALNATASFRAPLDVRARYFSSPFVFNVECNALLCAYTRVLAASQPYAARQHAFKRKSGHASPFNARKAIEDAFAMVARRFGGRRHVTLTEFASGNMFGPVPALHSLAQLGVREVRLHLIDKEYADWLRLAAEHPAAPPPRGAALPHAIDFGSVWDEWRRRVLAVAKGFEPDLVWEPHVEAVRDLVLAVAEAGQRRLADAKAHLERFEILNSSGMPEAAEAHAQLKASLATPLLPLEHGTIAQLAHELGSVDMAQNASALGELASLLQSKLAAAGAPTEALTRARDEATPLRDDTTPARTSLPQRNPTLAISPPPPRLLHLTLHSTPSPPLHAATTHRIPQSFIYLSHVQVALVHAWACSLGLKLNLTAYADKDAYLAATRPLSTDLVLGYDLDPASSDDFRHLISQTLLPDGFIVGGIQLTEVDPDTEVPKDPHRHTHEDHHGVKGNAYNFVTTPQHAATFDLVQGQMGNVPCFREGPSEALGCVEVGHNWFESLCEFGYHLGSTPQIADAFAEYTAGWPTGGRRVERCAAQRHFLGYIDDPDSEGINLRNIYFHRGLMAFCLFHSCKEVAPLATTDLVANGVVMSNASSLGVARHFFA
ncbi:hypothetical protein AB1Y20_019193 [Prymnesium parvum]|uniref:Uncharacterized protein n=1 Tax=Prymnesium parvum TaxID=97485 RepID=A0AB34JUC0_PRYPA